MEHTLSFGALLTGWIMMAFFWIVLPTVGFLYKHTIVKSLEYAEKLRKEAEAEQKEREKEEKLQREREAAAQARAAIPPPPAPLTQEERLAKAKEKYLARQ